MKRNKIKNRKRKKSWKSSILTNKQLIKRTSKTISYNKLKKPKSQKKNQPMEKNQPMPLSENENQSNKKQKL